MDGVVKIISSRVFLFPPAADGRWNRVRGCLCFNEPGFHTTHRDVGGKKNTENSNCDLKRAQIKYMLTENLIRLWLSNLLRAPKMSAEAMCTAAKDSLSQC